MNLLVNAPPQELVSFILSAHMLQKTASYGARLNLKNSNNFSHNDVIQMLSYLDPDMRYEDWLHVGMALHAGGFDFDLWED